MFPITKTSAISSRQLKRPSSRCSESQSPLTSAFSPAAAKVASKTREMSAHRSTRLQRAVQRRDERTSSHCYDGNSNALLGDDFDYSSRSRFTTAETFNHRSNALLGDGYLRHWPDTRKRNNTERPPASFGVERLNPFEPEAVNPDGIGPFLQRVQTNVNVPLPTDVASPTTELGSTNRKSDSHIFSTFVRALSKKWKSLTKRSGPGGQWTTLEEEEAWSVVKAECELRVAGEYTSSIGHVGLAERA